MKTLNLKLIKDLPKREAKYIRILRSYESPATVDQLYQLQWDVFKDNLSIIKGILKEQGFINYPITEYPEPTESQKLQNGDYWTAYFNLLNYYPEPTHNKGIFAGNISKHFTSKPPKNFPVIRAKFKGVYHYTLKP